ncbi:D-alanyl-D-alanine carboxypeptidase family protein [Clostridium sp.]|uniref:D-alanyl-D-alanine carboxypeptidase family protein n=1 Tax=Clostridium sp. TaxID=1506 RepID=UPI002631CF66|nr:D-alanyl-D-alanine carboxypeptidase family protein [Clostridium sp.]
MNITYENLKKELKFIISLAFVFILFSNVNAFANTNPPKTLGRGMVLMDGKTGQILAEKNANEKMAPASTTKTMTAILTIEKCNLNDVVTIGKNPPFADGTRVGLQEGDKYTVEQLLNAMLVQSANDAAMALAEHISGSEANFTKLMNEKAKEIGCTNTHFVNSSGLYEDDHYTTPHDLALIVNYASKMPKLCEITRKIVYEMPKSVVSGEPIWANNNDQIIHKTSKYYYKDIIYSKTGYTTKSKHTFACAAKRGDRTLILTLFYYDTKEQYYEEVKPLLDYGFNNFVEEKIYSKGDIAKEYFINDKNTLKLIVPEDIYMVFPKEEVKNLSIPEIRSKEHIQFTVKSNTPISRGTDLTKNKSNFTGTIMIGNTPYKSISLLNGNNITTSKFEKIMIKLQSFKGFYITLTIVSLVALVILILFIIRIVSSIKRFRNRKKRNNTYFYK